MGVLTRADLHIHSCLSPCGDNNMVPYYILDKAKEKKLNMIALTDHNTCSNVKPLMLAARSYGITIIPGMEATSSEEAHTIALFKNIDSAKEMEDFILSKLPGKNEDGIFGYQLIVDVDGEIVDKESRFLLGTPDIKLKDLVKKIKSLGGIAIASHIDRDSYSVISQLGFIPDDIQFDAVEISPRTSIDKAKEKYSEISLPMITSSDAHFPNDIGRVFTEIDLSECSFLGLKEYFENLNN